MRLRRTAKGLRTTINKFTRARRCPWGWRGILVDLGANIWTLHKQRIIKASERNRLDAQRNRARDRLEALCKR